MKKMYVGMFLCLFLSVAEDGYARQPESDLRLRMERVEALTDEEEAWNACQELMLLPAYGQDRLNIIDLYVRKGFRYTQKKFDEGCTDFEKIRNVLRQMYPYAVKAERREIKNAEAYLARLQAAYYRKHTDWDSTYWCLTQAYDGYTGLESSDQQAKILKDIRQVEQNFISFLENQVHFGGTSSVRTLSEVLSGELTSDEVGKILVNAIQDDSLNYTPRALFNYLIVKKHTFKLANEGEWRIHFLAMIRAADCYIRLKRYREAWDMCMELLSLPLTEPEKRKTERTALKCGRILASGLLYMEKPEYAEARHILERILLLARPDDVPEIKKNMARSWFLEGTDAFTEMKSDSAASCYRHALTLYQATGELEQQAVLLLQLSKIELSLGNPEEASLSLVQAQTLARRVGAQSLQEDITRMQLFLERSRDNRKAYADRAYEWDLRSDSLSTQKLYYEWGDRMVAQKNYKMAGYYYGKSLSGSGPLSRDVLLSVYYSKMCNMYLEAGDYARAEKYGSESLALGKITRYTEWIRQGIIYARQNKRKEFEACFRHLKEFAGSMQSEPRECALIYTTRALSYMFFKEWQKAYGDLQTADSILTVRYGEEDSGRLNVLSLMGTALCQMKKPDEARERYQICVRMAQRCFGENSVACSEALEKLAQTEVMLGEKKSGCRLYARSARSLQEYLKSQLRYVSATERESFWNANSENLWNLSAYAVLLDARDNDFTESCYDALLFSKGVLLETEKSLNQVLQEEGSSEDRNLFEEMAALQHRMKEFERHENFSRDTLAVWQARMQKLDHQLTVRSKAYGDYTAFLGWDFSQVKNCLKEKEVLIDFVDYTSLQNERVYAAYLVRKNSKYPLLLSLFTQEELEHLMQKGPMDRLYRPDSSAQALRLLWDPIRPYVSEGETVYYVPSGNIYQVALESLPADDGSLLGEHYRFVRLSSSRELASRAPLVERPATAALYGGLQYDLSEGEMQAESRKYPLSVSLASRSVLRGDSAFVSLPESAEEVRQIAGLLQADHYRVTIYEGASGSEESFLSLSGCSPRLLHVATHGFYYTPDEARQIDYLRGFQDAMYLSGLILSGGNTAWLGKRVPDGVQDGILTARDIAALDLSGTELVVLSACQTGQGKVTAEGLYGLQRAFKKAGVRTLVMTLWRVSDRVTREFMVAFYQNLLAGNNNKREAFEKARMQIRNRYPEPFYWAGFVMTD